VQESTKSPIIESDGVVTAVYAAFERAPDAHLKKLYQFDQNSLRKIDVAARKVTSIKAVHLLIKCLQPIPDDRPSNMDEILRHPYFDDINTI